MAVAKGKAPRAQDRAFGTSTKVSELVNLEHKVALNQRDEARPTPIRAKYADQDDQTSWWKRLAA